MNQKDPAVCGAPHPTIPGLLCERTKCVEYHLSGGVVWTEGAAKLPPRTVSPQRMNALMQRTEARRRETRNRSRGSDSSS